jgi:hypothetical protein
MYIAPIAPPALENTHSVGLWCEVAREALEEREEDEGEKEEDEGEEGG